jgi:hypothetical protein
MAKAEYHSGCHDFSTGSKIWEGQDLKQALNSLAFSPAAVRQLTVCPLAKVLKFCYYET